jgi:hypothetical protein
MMRHIDEDVTSELLQSLKKLLVEKEASLPEHLATKRPGNTLPCSRTLASIACSAHHARG